MPLPWNRGDEDPLWVDLLPLVGGSGDRSASDRERRQPVLVAPHRDPGEDAVNHDMPPGFETAGGSAGAPGGSGSAPSEAVDARAGADSPPGAGSRDPVGTDAGSPDAVTPGAAPLEAITSDAATPEPDEESATADRGTDDPEDEQEDSTDLQDTVTVNGQ